MRLSLKAKTLSLVVTLMMALSTLAWLPSPAASANGCGGSDFNATWDSGSVEGGKFVGRAGQSATFRVTWNVPRTVKPGETYTVTIPDEVQILGAPDAIEARDPQGAVVATGRWNGKTITFTYSNYVKEKENVRVSFRQEVTWDSRFNTRNADEDLPRMTFRDTCGATVDLHGKFLGTPSGTIPGSGKSGYFPFQADSNSDGLGGFDKLKVIEWSLYATGYLAPHQDGNQWLSWDNPDYFLIEDKIPAGQRLVCTSAGKFVTAPTVRWATALNDLLEEVSPSVAKAECDAAANTFKVTLDMRKERQRRGDHIVVKLFTVTDDAIPGKTYDNVAKVTASRYGGQEAPQKTDNEEYLGHAKRAGWGAEGEGEEGYGDIALKKDAVGVDSAVNQKYVFDVSCVGRSPERVELKSGEYRYIKRIPKGTQCTVTEVDPPKINGVSPTVSYTVDGQTVSPVQFAIRNRATVYVQAVNTYTQPPTKLVVQKKISNNGELTADGGWKFTAEATGAKLGQPAEQITDGAGTASWTINHESAAVATIKVGEDLQSKEGFAFKSATCEVVDANKSAERTIKFNTVPGTLTEVKPGSTITCEFINQPNQGSVEWAKHDTAGELLGGSEWTLTGKNSAPITITDCVSQAPEQCQGPDKDPRGGVFKVNKLSWGEYTLSEAIAPAGYLRDSTEHSFTIGAESNSVKLGPFVNVKVGGPHIPLTGGLGRDAFIFCGALVLAVGAFVVGRSLLHGKTAA
ncbi:Ig-like domain-containing protein [Trueperella pyogenes]|uniref:Ig-like domain-containing protein n=1 Tax=Trueperella pyogenes TaxID=1661 RepID=UPI000A5A0B19|nr:Ig-like domain-containing protein [Trueperella pyogenes]